MKRQVLSLIMILAIVVFSVPLAAHHGEATYDTNKVVSVRGTVTSFQFINPHVLISMDVRDERGKIERWVGEARSPTMLVRLGGWNKDTIKIGEMITASGHRAKNGLNVLRLQKIVLQDGREMAGLS